MQSTHQTLSVEEYTRHFVKKIVKDEKYRDSTELYDAGKTFYSLLQRFAREGDREDVRTPFKIIKDEFVNEWRISSGDARDELIRRLFGVLDIVHEECQSSVQNCVNGTEVSYTILEEFRLRLMKMVVGESWKEALPLRLEALKHMHKYRNRELDGYYTQESRKNTLKQRARHLTVKKLKRTMVGPAKSSWTAVFNELLLESGSRLAPLLFAILDENQAMEDRLLSIAPAKSTDMGSHKGSVLSSKSGSSVSSSSLRLPSSDVDSALPATDEEGPRYYKSLNSELNAKLQLFKQGGLANMRIKTRQGSHESGGGLNQQYSAPLIEDDATVVTSKSDELGSRDSHVNGVRRSMTPFSDEAPPPWDLQDLNMQMVDMRLLDGEMEMGSQSLGMDGGKDTMLQHSASVQATRYPAEAVAPKFQKSPSYHATSASAFTSHFATAMLPPQPKPPENPLLPSDERTQKRAQLFDELDPFAASERTGMK